VKITCLIQADIVEWLETAGEFRAASWFEEYWCGEKGNYSNVTAGCVGNCVASGIETHWRYLREDTVGTSGTNQGISLEVFAGSLVRYMKTSSERHGGHANKILDEKTGSHIFPSTPTISMKMCKKVQTFDVQRLLLAHFQGSVLPKRAKTGWRRWSGLFQQKSISLGFMKPVVLCRRYHAVIAEAWSSRHTVITNI
jgi:hypothetical protein